jgi:Ca-activated chloride channel family protein
MFHTRKSGALSILLCATAAIAGLGGVWGSAEPSGAQSTTEAAQSSAVIRVDSNLVTVPVSITDAKGNIVTDLRLEDFLVEENGRIESIAKVVKPGETSLDLALLLDVSGSVQPRFAFERDAAAGFLRKVLKPGDQVMILSIGHVPRVVQPKTTDFETAISRILAAPGSKSSTAFFDSVIEAALLLRKSGDPERRRVQVALTDGEDNNSAEPFLGETIRTVQRADCIFYAINPAGPSIRLNKMSVAAQQGLEALASQTGGTAFVPDTIADLQIMFDRIAKELRAQYLLEYYSSDQRRDGSFRQIVVRIPNRPDLRVRARQGYYSS